MKLRRTVPFLMMLSMGVAGTFAADEKAKAPKAENAGIAGAWACVQNFPDNSQRPFDMKLTQEGDAVKGTVFDADGTVVASVTGERTADGFKLLVSTGAEPYEAKGTVDGDKIKGTWTTRDMQGTWEGTRKPAN